MLSSAVVAGQIASAARRARSRGHQGRQFRRLPARIEHAQVFPIDWGEHHRHSRTSARLTNPHPPARQAGQRSAPAAFGRVVDGEQLLGIDPRNRVQPRAAAASKDNALHVFSSVAQPQCASFELTRSLEWGHRSGLAGALVIGRHRSRSLKATCARQPRPTPAMPALANRSLWRACCSPALSSGAGRLWSATRWS